MGEQAGVAIERVPRVADPLRRSILLTFGAAVLLFLIGGAIQPGFLRPGNVFAVLVVAEMLGVKAGLGWYLQWAQGWAAYANMYAALLIMALVCSGLITMLFRLRDRLLSWQKGLVRW